MSRVIDQGRICLNILKTQEQIDKIAAGKKETGTEEESKDGEKKKGWDPVLRLQVVSQTYFRRKHCSTGLK